MGRGSDREDVIAMKDPKKYMREATKYILLVDDEERLLDSMAQRISLLGFEPIKASSGIKALDIAKKTRIDLAIVDLKMPDMDGSQDMAVKKQNRRQKRWGPCILKKMPWQVCGM